MYPQNLPTYTHKFLEYKDWIKCETTHYIFNYTSGSEAEKDIEVIKETQENAYKKITSFLKLEKDENKIEYYFYPDPKTKKDLMGDDWYAQSIYNEYRVHVLYTADDKPIGPHEDTHLLTLCYGLSMPFIQEGLADYMVAPTHL